MYEILFLITPLLGFIKNFVKYKNNSLTLFLRTPLLCILIYNILNLFKFKNPILLSIIFERWIMFIYKINLSIINDDYTIKKKKYIKKYNLKY